MLLNLFEIAHEFDLRVALREVNQVQILLHLLCFLGLYLSLHIDKSNVTILLHFATLFLVFLQYDFVLTINESCVAHLVIKLIRVAQFSLQCELL